MLIDKRSLLGQLSDFPPDSFISIQTVRAMIENAPEESGQWLERVDDMYFGGGAWVCSACGYAFSFGMFSILDDQNYCPHCGAKMEAKEDGENL